MESDRSKSLAPVKKVVIKIGSSLLTGDKSTGIRGNFLGQIASQIQKLRARGVQFTVVSSGAISAGLFELKLKKRPKAIPQLQALAAVGQSSLMHAYEKTFRKRGLKVAQVLLTREDLSDRSRYSNARNTFTELFKNKIIPIVNENDTVAVEEIKFGDNDTLAVLVSHLTESDFLVLLTDTDGLYEVDPKLNPKAKIISNVKTWDVRYEKSASASKTSVGTGGMITKIRAAKNMMESGIPMAIVNGNSKGILLKLMKGLEVGSFFHPVDSKMKSRDRWLAWSVKPKGEIGVDDGARKAILENHKSLLPSGVKWVQGTWGPGDVIKIVDAQKRELARGIANCSSLELERIKGLRTEAARRELGYSVRAEVVHCDNMVRTEN
jgi:glutamate 5-kinase